MGTVQHKVDPIYCDWLWVANQDKCHRLATHYQRDLNSAGQRVYTARCDEHKCRTQTVEQLSMELYVVGCIMES